MKIIEKDSENFIFEIHKEQLILVPKAPLLYSNSKKYHKIVQLIKSQKIIKSIQLDFSEQINFDTYLIIFYKKIEKYCKKHQLDFKTINSSDDINAVIGMMNSSIVDNAIPKPVLSPFRRHIQHIGDIIIHIAQDTYNFISFFGELFIRLITLIFHPSRMRWRDLPGHFTQSGVFALPITVMIVFLIGLITGYQGALQLKQFGADNFIANLIGISLTRELSPLMVAILVAGRSGSAFAAELGTMKVSEEIDALNTLGFDSFEFLVLPRVVSVTLAMPLLVIICNVVGMVGGLIAALTTLDVTTSGYILRMQSALSLLDISTGLFKSIIFGFLIASLGCYKGLNVTGGADAVGKITTASVVASVFLIILSDAIFTFIFQALGI
jgi:phospholipid/cholesterol/gamma-HCH transport system permease protein